jgi:hypothetical protein
VNSGEDKRNGIITWKVTQKFTVWGDDFLYGDYRKVAYLQRFFYT